MFDWVLNTPPEYYNNFFSDVSTLKLMAFWFFFSTINFSYKYLPEAKVYLEPNRTSRMELFRNFFPKNSQENTYPRLFLLKLQTGLYPQN